MRFEDVTHQLGAVVSRPGTVDDGKPLNDAIPSLRNMRIWQAVYGGYSWSIVHEPGVREWSAEEKREHVGFTASYRRLEHRGSSQTIRIDGGPWDSFAKAEAACRRTWQQIRRAN